MESVRRWGLIIALGAVALGLILSGARSFSQEQVAEEQPPPVGRYQIACFGNVSSSTRGMDGIYGYYVLDTATGQVITEKVNRIEHKDFPPLVTRLR